MNASRRKHPRITRHRGSGFSIVELLVSITIGLIIIGAVTALVVSTVDSVNRNVGATRLMQELRGGMSVMTRELRRAGYDRDATEAISLGVFPTGYGAITIRNGGTVVTAGNPGDCLVMSYDKVGVNDTANAPGVGEWKAFRRKVVSGRGILQVNTTANPPSCTTDAGWVDLTSPNDINVTQLAITHVNSTKIPAGPAQVEVREIRLELRAALVSDAATVRGLDETVRVRSDLVTF